MKHLAPWLAVAAAAAALAACNNGNSNNNNPSVCQTPSGSQPVLIYPAPNSTAIPDAFGQIIVATTAGFPGSWNVVITSQLTGAVGGGNFANVSPPFPKPHATPPYANPVYQASGFGSALIPGQVISVYVNNTGSNCNPAGPIGSFTTQ